MIRMKTKTAIKKATSINKLAALTDVKRQSIQKWGENLPPEREKLLRERKPEWFK